MEENRGRDVALPLPDQEVEAEDVCRSEVTRMEMDESSVTVDSSRVFSSHNAEAGLEKSAGWTDEKHNLYLDYLEASFVQELRNSILPSQGKFWRPFFSDRRSANTTSSSNQDTTTDSHIVLESPWITQFMSTNKHQSAISHCRTESFVGSTIEGSDQNFVSEEVKSSSTSTKKGLKRTVNDASIGALRSHTELTTGSSFDL